MANVAPTHVTATPTHGSETHGCNGHSNPRERDAWMFPPLETFASEARLSDTEAFRKLCDIGEIACHARRQLVQSRTTTDVRCF